MSHHAFADATTRRRLMTFCLCAVAALVPATAGATGEAIPASPLRLSYSAPEACPTETAFIELVRERTPHLVIADGQMPAKAVSVRLLANGPNGFAADVTLADSAGAQGHRALIADSCNALAQAAALVVSLDLIAAEPLPSTEPLPQPQVAPPTEASEPVSPAPTSLASRRAPLISAMLIGGMRSGVAGMPTPWVGAGIELQEFGERRWFAPALRLSAGVSWGHTTVSSTERILHQLPMVALDGAIVRASWLDERIVLTPYLRFEAGPALAELASDPNRATTAPWLAPGALLRLRVWPMKRLFIEAEGGALVPLVRNRYVVDSFGVFVLPPVAGHGSISAGLSL